jgi:hypothetical protein
MGDTDTLNLPVAINQEFEFHPSESPFHMTNVLTTYGKVVASPGCTVDVIYDDKIQPKSGYHTGRVTVTAHNDCGPGSCISVVHMDSHYDAASECRIKYNDECSVA